MKNLSVIVLVLVLVSVLILAPVSGANEQKLTENQIEKYTTITERNLKLLANALELYANDHYQEYPSEKIFFSPEFHKYISLAYGKQLSAPEQFYLCPGIGKVDYNKFENKLAFKVSCPKPQLYDLKAFYFSSGNGYVKSDGSQKAGVEKPVVTENKWKDVNGEEREAMLGVIQTLHKAYEAKDLEKVMDIEKEAIVRSGLEMEKQGKYTAEEVYYAYKGTANDVFRASGFGMKPLNTKAITFRRRGDTYQAYSVIPVVSTERVTVGTMKVQLRISTFEFEKNDDGEFIITKMEMY